jgi:hypothetical protein
MTIGLNSQFHGPPIKPGLDMHTDIREQAAIEVDEQSGKPCGLGIWIARQITAEQVSRWQMLQR